MFRFEVVTEEHMRALAENMREEEVAEVWASIAQAPLSAIRTCVTASYETVAGVYDEDVLGIVGCVRPTLLSCTASPWLLTTNDMKKHPKELLRWSKRFIHKWANENDVLINYIDARYEQSVRWARWLGFAVYPAEPYGCLQLPFHKIEFRRV